MDGLKQNLLEKTRRIRELKKENPKSVEERVDRIERLLGLK